MASPVLLTRHYRPTTDLAHEPARRLLRGEAFACESLTNETKLQKIWQGPGCSYSYKLTNGIQIAGYTDGGPTLTGTKPNEDAMALGISGNEIISLVADGVGSHDNPELASKQASARVLTGLLAGRPLKSILSNVVQDWRADPNINGGSATTLTASRFWETEGAWHFQHAGLGNSDSLLLSRTHDEASWQLISKTEEHTFSAHLRQLTLILTQPSDHSAAQQEKKSQAFQLWRDAMQNYKGYCFERKSSDISQLVAKADKAITSSANLSLDLEHPQIKEWIKAGLFVFTNQQKKNHPAVSVLTEALGPNTEEASLPEFSEPLLLVSGLTYLEVKSSDGFSDIFDLDETLALLQEISSAQDAVALLAGAAFLAMDAHVKTKRLINQLRRNTDRLDLCANERFAAIHQLQQSLSKIDNLTVQAVLLRP